MTLRQQTPAPAAQTSNADTFPAGFRWGVATAAYQIEGAAAEYGRGPSIWDTFSHTPGAITDGSTGDVACDHYHRFRDDVRLMAEMGIRSYRFSISWPRVQPDGHGPVNTAGLDFYRELVDELLAHDIEPWPTLYHWDLPQPLEDAGGWPNRDTAPRFAEYAAIVHDALGDRIGHWTTLNEPWCSAFLGYGAGEHAPGRRDGLSAVRAAHHLMLAHGQACEVIRAANSQVKLGVTLNLYAVSPASAAPADADAVRRIDGLANRIFLDPILRGEYPADVLDDLSPLTSFEHLHDDDLGIISAPLSFLGINYYSRYVVAAPESGDGARPSENARSSGDTSPSSDGGAPDNTTMSPDEASASAWPGSETVRFVERDVPVTAMGWEIDPVGLAETLVRVHREYTTLPLYVTENGAAFDDVADDHGTVDDPERIAFIDAHLRACHDAIDEGVPLRGYFAWTFMDNFEWAHGYTKRFGLVRVDFSDQRRIPKSSAEWYAGVIQRNGLPIMGS
ncbi:beta-glucosidase [Actinobacteria bacterium YIM 96077]|uniref:beta-glucosidase n=1 Tax=Phytoactinopolyspora halophila TaxID=1981511 RepID=A0A329QAD5_9ACTN|nr:beta-glucosidase [Phytoactinopolyspora halophila]AYY12907.1 beta-glucosidase [Actinobacteria bacterium YIM 96077]RAW09296.1 beta-glucosidase [Phytoactinopolyspora halophila]